MNLKTHKFGTFFGFYAATFVAASSAAVWDVGGDWYQSLNQPSFTPPNWLFGPVWSTIYLLIAISAYRISYSKRSPWKAPSLALWSLQIALNTLWTPVFFGAYSLGSAFIYIGLLWLSICALIAATFKVEKLAALLLLPYLAWVSFAAALNYAFWQLN